MFVQVKVYLVSSRAVRGEEVTRIGRFFKKCRRWRVLLNAEGTDIVRKVACSVSLRQTRGRDCL